MALDKTKLLLTFAVFGFLIGVTSYFALDWLILNTAIQPIPILELIFAPWFISGLAGSVLSILIIFVSARFTSDN